jgi:hypothetical protein
VGATPATSSLPAGYALALLFLFVVVVPLLAISVIVVWFRKAVI